MRYPAPTWIRISETPSPTGVQSPKFPNVALVKRASILAFAFWSPRRESHVSKSDDRSKGVHDGFSVSEWILLDKQTQKVSAPD